jgi:hypothetical protein
MTKRLLLAGALSMGVTGSTASAGDLFTPAPFIGDSHNAICRLTNVSNTPVPAQVQVWGVSGLGSW